MRYFLIITILFLTFVFSNCGNSNPTNNSNSTTTTPNTAKSPVNPGGLPSPSVKPETSATNNAPTLTPVVQAFFDALIKKDEAGVKKHLSAAALKYWEDEGKTAKQTWLAYMMEDLDPIAEKREVRNEKIEGKKAYAEIKGGNLGVWTKTGFVEENGEWKFDSPAVIFKETDIRNNSAKPNNPNS